jgi:hypothetical protein
VSATTTDRIIDAVERACLLLVVLPVAPPLVVYGLTGNGYACVMLMPLGLCVLTINEVLAGRRPRLPLARACGRDRRVPAAAHDRTEQDPHRDHEQQ